VGPNLHGVVGRRAASVEGFRYSNAMKEKGSQGWTWTEDNRKRGFRAHPG
jgi:cytochrome c